MAVTYGLELGSSKSTIFLFGPHVGTFTRQSMGGLVQSLSQSPQRDWILDTVAGLPTYWKALTNKIPDITIDIAGSRSLAELESWLQKGAAKTSQDTSNLPSMIVGPLVVLIQLTQYWRYLELTRIDNSEVADLQADLVARLKSKGGPKVEALGFCAGLLAALAVSSASNQQEFQEFGAVAVRLAMLIGALIDAQEAWDIGSGKGSSASYAIAWRGNKQEEDLARIITDLSPNAYVAVQYDQARATITVSEGTAPLLLKRFRAAGITAAEVGIKGQIHSPSADRGAHTSVLVDLCNSLPGLQYADVASLALPTYDNQGKGKAMLPGQGSMTEMVLRSILVQKCHWYDTFSAVTEDHQDPFVVTFGLERCVPPTLMRTLGTAQVFFADMEKDAKQPSCWLRDTSQRQNQLEQRHHQQQKQTTSHPQQHELHTINPVTDLDSEAIAIVGMSVRTAGADDLDEFAEMLKTGKSQHEPITRERLMHDMLFREAADKDPKRKFYGCFLRQGDAFDHKFFKRSPRESAAMDPQSRIVLQAAYQAVEQSGYFTENMTTRTPDGRDKSHVGVYLGSCGVDYEHNITCHEPNAFTATGALKSFITGRVSHHFGWTGPCMTFDTACSSSALAIHTACRNLLSGECTAALAGGSNTVTNMLWFQNLAAGSFVSPTGQCKPFDDDADGYCRAEGVAFVFLKKLSDAIRDGNPVLAKITSSAVYQNQNSTPLFVPNSPSLSHLFKDVMRRAKVTANDVSLVEAHGTGTPVGDPAEYESILLALGGPVRDKKLPIGSVKGHIGHTEGASGAIALVKIITMMRGGFIPPQASFHKMNRNISVKPDDMLEVVTNLRPWDEVHKTALLNNYGACGSNASMIVTQPDQALSDSSAIRNRNVENRYPFWIPGLDIRAVSAYCAKLKQWLWSCREEPALMDVSFNVNRQSNRGLSQGFIFSCRSMTELNERLNYATEAPSARDVTANSGIALVKVERPVILCFGGQVSRFVGLDRKLFESAAVLRRHLDDVDAVVTCHGLDSIYPGIFAREPVHDTVQLQTMLFAMQYACAKSWLDCGLESKIKAVVGHSFGEITALCVSGVLSLEHAIQLVASRAKLVRDGWGDDPGAMMAVEADHTLVSELLAEANRGFDGSASIACYNGPSSFTLAGPTGAIDAVRQAIASNAKFGSIKSKMLSVTNAFHSSLVDNIGNSLDQIGKTLAFGKPIIPVERATEMPSGADEMDGSFVYQHMRKPVFFNHAVQRLVKRHPEAIFLEAGSNSTITHMAARAVAKQVSAPDKHHFQAVSITTDAGFDGLTDATITLWRQGLRVSFWSHHAAQTLEHAQLLLPPYQFDQSSRHWLPMKSPLEAVNKAAAALVAASGGAGTGQHQPNGIHQDPKMQALWDFVGFQDGDNKRPRFRINASSATFNKFVLSHVIAQTAPICPGTLECDIFVEALFSIGPNWKDDGVQPVVHDMVNHSPICVDPSRTAYLDLTALNKNGTKWSVRIFSVESNSRDQSEETHAEASVNMCARTDAAHLREFANFERLVSHRQCLDVLKLNLDQDGVEVLHGRNLYRAFTSIVDYGEIYRGVRYIVGRGDESAGLVQLPKRHRGDTWLDVPLSDNFSQVGGLWVNLMTDLPPGDMYIATGCELSIRSPKAPDRADTDVWHVYARHSRQDDKNFLTDLFVFDAATGQLVEVMLGVQYGRVAKSSMSRMLARMTKDPSVLRVKAPSATTAAASFATPAAAIASPTFKVGEPARMPRKTTKTRARVNKSKGSKKKGKASAGRRDITDEVCNLVATVSGIDVSELELDAEMANFGIDSLMGMELAKEVEMAFKCQLDQAEQMEATTLRKFVACVSNALFGTGQGQSPVDEGEGVEDEESEESSSESSSAAGRDGAWSQWGGEKPSSGSETPDTGSDTPQLGEVSKKAVPIPKSSGFVAMTAPAVSRLALSSSHVLESFGEVKMATDKLMREYGVHKTEKGMLAGSNRLCTALVVEALDELGCPLRTAAPGQIIDKVPFLPQHGRLMQWVYDFLERDARLIDVDVAGGCMTRTHIAAPRKTSSAVFQELLAADPDFSVPNRLTYYAGRQLAGVLSGATDGIRVLFGSPEGRELVAAMYCEHTFNCMSYTQMREMTQKLADHIQSSGVGAGETLKVLEMGAGTGGTTLVMAPMLASLAAAGNMQVEYTFTDLSPSMVANARRLFGKKYPFMRFAVHDIEKVAADELKGQHLVLASNAIHATHDLRVSLSNIHQALRSDGFLMMLEMTEVVPFVDLVFGLLEGWWLFDDGRSHAVVPAEHWECQLHAAGFGHVDWTDGSLPENTFQKVIIALASGTQGPRLPKPAPTSEPIPELQPGNVEARKAEAERLIATYSSGWATPELRALHAKREGKQSNHGDKAPSRKVDLGAVVLVTGATGSLGSHLVQKLAEDPKVAQVVCLNRRSSSAPAEKRQQEAFVTRGITLSPSARAKLRILEIDTSKAQLGLPPLEYSWLVQHGTAIVHNAWPMSGTRPVSAFEPQLQAMRILLDLARDMACRDVNSPSRVGFQFVSSIGVVGCSGESRVLERRFPLSAVLPSGYGDAKWVCERMLDETLHKHPQLFGAMVVRPGQISGSSTSGFWNPVEHFAFLVKSAQALRAWPDLEGVLQWIPVNQCAGIMVDLLKIGSQDQDTPEAYAVYHIDNPVGQQWKDMSPVLAAALDIPPHAIIPFKSWISRVRRSPLPLETENPAARLVDFLDDHFERMSCGGLILDTSKAQEHSRTMASADPVSSEIARLYVASWKKMGHLN